MNPKIKERVIEHAVCLISERSTIREVAKKSSVSKTTVHKDLTKVLPDIAPSLAKEVREILDLNTRESYIRGGMSTKAKFENAKTRKSS